LYRVDFAHPGPDLNHFRPNYFSDYNLSFLCNNLLLETVPDILTRKFIMKLTNGQSQSYPILLVALLLSLFTAQISAQCAACDSVSTILSNCSLPALSANASTLPPASYKDVSGLSYPSGSAIGPNTTILATYQQASCFCSTGIQVIRSCSGCINSTYPAPSSNLTNEQTVANIYYNDCTSFGYYANATFGVPTTTVTSVPPPTADPSSGTNCDICSVIAGTLDSCHLPSLESDPVANETTFFSRADNTFYSAYYLFNRTAGQCACTLGVLNTMSSCGQCLASKSQQQVLGYYESDCHDLGYWPQASVSAGSVGYATGGASQSSGATKTVDWSALSRGVAVGSVLLAVGMAVVGLRI
jgi:hypothetical protein